MPSDRVDVIEFTDPLCSVAWGAEPIFRLFRWRYGDLCNWRTVMGGLGRGQNPERLCARVPK